MLIKNDFIYGKIYATKCLIIHFHFIFDNMEMTFIFFLLFKSKSNLLFYLLYYAKACNEFERPISASLRETNTAPLKEILQRWQAVSNTVFDLTCLRFEPLIYSCRDECVTARPIGLILFVSTRQLPRKRQTAKIEKFSENSLFFILS